jgi:dipeptidyl aminopeptidase/acylaminoacyl peptidase
MNLRFRSLLTVFAGIVLASASPHHQADPPQRWSPDKALFALVYPTNRGTAIASSENLVEVRSARGKLLAQEDFTSQDGEHGYAVSKAEWTPDSQFFVFSLESSGGHSPWHSPTKFYARKQQRIMSLDDALHNAVTREFVISAPDKVTVHLWFKRRKVTVSLSELAEAATNRGQ